MLKKHTFTQILRGFLNVIGSMFEKGVGVTLSHLNITVSSCPVLHILKTVVWDVVSIDCQQLLIWHIVIKEYYKSIFFVYSLKLVFHWLDAYYWHVPQEQGMSNILSSISPKNSLINKCLISQLYAINFTPCRYNNLQENYMLWEIYLLENVKADN